MKIVIPGGTGQVGTVLARAFHADGHKVVVFGRSPEKQIWRTEKWDGKSLGDWANEIDGSDVVINLAGRSVNCRYNEENRRQMMDSRVNSTRVVGEAITNATRPPRVWLQASTATIYAHRFDAPNDDVTGVIGGHENDAPDTWNFSIDVATAWEKAVNDAATPKTRKVLMRSAMTMSAMEWQLAIGAFFMQTETELILKSRRVVPKLLTDSGFEFEFPDWSKACRDLYARWREMNR